MQERFPSIAESEIKEYFDLSGINETPTLENMESHISDLDSKIKSQLEEAGLPTDLHHWVEHNVRGRFNWMTIYVLPKIPKITPDSPILDIVIHELVTVGGYMQSWNRSGK